MHEVQANVLRKDAILERELCIGKIFSEHSWIFGNTS